MEAITKALRSAIFMILLGILWVLALFLAHSVWGKAVAVPMAIWSSIAIGLLIVIIPLMRSIASAMTHLIRGASGTRKR
jgi:hypothetical protein